MKYGSIAIAILIIGLALSMAGCTKTTESVATTTVTTSGNGQTTTTTQGSGTATTASQATATTVTATTATTTTATTAVTTSGGSTPGSRTAVPPATLGSCTPGDPYMGYHTIALSGSNYGQYAQFTTYTITVVWRDYSAAPFTPTTKLWVVDTVYNISVLKQQMGSKGGYWGQTLDDVNHYAAYFTSQGYDGWEYLNKGTQETWVGIDIGNGIYVYAHSDGAYAQATILADMEAFVDGLDLGCWAVLAPP